MNIRDAIIAVVAARNLSQAEAASVMETIMSGEATPAQIGAFLTALHLKGETDAEIAGMAEVMRQKATPVYVDGPVADTCGTGGDGSHTFNISTAAAFVAAGAGLAVAKHGNRAMSSVCGSADVLEGLGVKIDLDADGVARCLREAGIGFMFAPKFHPAMRFAGPVRREIGIRTAVGARRSHLIGQFLLEAVILTGLGGLAGTLLGSLTQLIEVGGFSPVVTPFSVGLALSFSVVTGLFFGLYPANRAASMPPVQALRHE